MKDVALLLLVLLGIWFFWPQISSYMPNLQQGNIAAPTQTPASNQVAVMKPLQVAVVDPVAGSAVSSATVKIYQGTVLKESLTTDSTGKATSTLPYKSGTVLSFEIINGNSKEWKTITVPYMSPQDAQSLTTNFIDLPFFTLGTYSIKVMDQFGNVYASGGTINFTALGADTITLTISVYNSQDNTGYVSSYDPINKVNWYAYLLASTSGTSVSVTGFEKSVQRGTTTYYMVHVPDDGLTRQLVGQQYVKPGTWSYSITINKGSLAAGSTQSFTITLWAYFDPNYFANNGVGSPDALSLATFTLNVAA